LLRVDIVSYAIGWLLAATLLLSGTLKAADPAGAAKSLRDYGLPAGAAPAIAGLLAATAEVAAALLLVGTLLAGTGRSLGFAVTLFLFSFFAGLQARSLILGRQHPCGCFGRDEPVSRRTLARSALLAGAAAAALAATVGGAQVPTGARLLLSFVVAAATATIATTTWIVRASRAAPPVPIHIRRAGGIFAARASTTER
jgi:hypothetical protein